MPSHDRRNNLDINIRMHRKFREMTLSELAKEVGASYPTIQGLEIGTPERSNPTLRVLAGLARTFEITIDGEFTQTIELDVKREDV